LSQLIFKLESARADAVGKLILVSGDILKAVGERVQLYGVWGVARPLQRRAVKVFQVRLQNKAVLVYSLPSPILLPNCSLQGNFFKIIVSYCYLDLPPLHQQQRRNCTYDLSMAN